MWLWPRKKNIEVKDGSVPSFFYFRRMISDSKIEWSQKRTGHVQLYFTKLVLLINLNIVILLGINIWENQDAFIIIAAFLLFFSPIILIAFTISLIRAFHRPIPIRIAIHSDKFWMYYKNGERFSNPIALTEVISKDYSLFSVLIVRRQTRARRGHMVSLPVITILAPILSVSWKPHELKQIERQLIDHGAQPIRSSTVNSFWSYFWGHNN